MSNIQIGFNNGLIKHLLIYFLCIPCAFASTTDSSSSKNTVTHMMLARKSSNTGCVSCHTGKHAYNRRSLLEKKDQLTDIILDCHGPHDVYCHHGVSSLRKQAPSIVRSLKAQYKLGK